jgi:hypothetical protein
MGGRDRQLLLLDDHSGADGPEPAISERTTTTFHDNMRLPVHRWFRLSAGFSARWAESVIREHTAVRKTVVLDPFAGSGTTLLAAQDAGVESSGIEAHPFLARIAKAKLARTSEISAYQRTIERVKECARRKTGSVDPYPTLIRNCYTDEALCQLDVLRQAIEAVADGSPSSELAWLTLVSILRRVSRANTAQWQYVLPKKSKKNPESPLAAFDAFSTQICQDMRWARALQGPAPLLLQGDARTCEGIPPGTISLVITSPPYPNNYDYADATRLEMSFLREIDGWGDLRESVRQHLVCSCTQHVSEQTVHLQTILESEMVGSIRADLAKICDELARIRLTKGGRKNYHLMVARYFLDLAQVWRSLRAVCGKPSSLCFVVGDSAPYGVHVPVMDWLGRLALAAGFTSFRFDQTRHRNVKWKNRKHRVPLCEGRLWVEG